jgi:hypothetical protein
MIRVYLAVADDRCRQDYFPCEQGWNEGEYHFGFRFSLSTFGFTVCLHGGLFGSVLRSSFLFGVWSLRSSVVLGGRATLGMRCSRRLLLPLVMS